MEWAWLPSNKTLFMVLIFEFYLISTCHEILCFWCLPTFETPKHTSSSGVTQTQMASRVWPAGSVCLPRQRRSSLLLEWPSGSAWWIPFRLHRWETSLPWKPAFTSVSMRRILTPAINHFLQQVVCIWSKARTRWRAAEGRLCGKSRAHLQSLPSFSSSSLLLTRVGVFVSRCQLGLLEPEQWRGTFNRSRVVFLSGVHFGCFFFFFCKTCQGHRDASCPDKAPGLTTEWLLALGGDL